MSFPVLETDRLTLNEISAADVDAIFELFSDDAVVQYYDLEPFREKSQAVSLIDHFCSRYDNETGIRWAIRLKETRKLIGTCGVNSWSAPMKSAVIGYDLKPTYWGNGFITEAVYCMLKAIYSGELPCGHVNRIQADTIPGNVASEKVLRKLGFKEEGIRRQAGFWKNKFHDLKCFGLIQSEFG